MIRRQPTLDDIADAVRDFTGIDVRAVGNARTSTIVEARILFACVARDETGCSLPEIARAMKFSAHSSVMSLLSKRGRLDALGYEVIAVMACTRAMRRKGYRRTHDTTPPMNARALVAVDRHRLGWKENRRA